MGLLWAVIALFVGAGALWWRFLRLHHIDYPDAATLIRQPPQPQDFLTVEGTFNFRDIGGYLTAEGRTVKRGLIYRSARLNNLTENGVQTLKDFGLRSVYDLRSEAEVRDAPDKLPDGTKHLTCVLHTDRDVVTRAILTHRKNLRGAQISIYIDVILERNARNVGTVIESLSHPEDLPAVIHCTAGKDRTGLTVALLLSLLNVPEETILADYTLSNTFYAEYYQAASYLAGKLRFLRARPEDMWPFIVAEADTLQAALNHLRTRYGSIEHYLVKKAGVSPQAIERIRETMLK